MIEYLPIHCLDIGKLYNTSYPRSEGSGIPLYQQPIKPAQPRQEPVGVLKPDEYFMLLAFEKNYYPYWTKILTSNGNVGWCSWDAGRRFDQISI
ncbi:MAG: SH3 domain-containing protein [Proteobacteria bacterium]|nr:SH3 domain-containing protein [Pseudomonadota bacterium]